MRRWSSAPIAMALICTATLATGGPSAGAEVASWPPRVIDTIVVSPPQRPDGIDINRVTNKVYVAAGDTLPVIDASTDVVVTTIPLPVSAHAVAVNERTNRVYVTGSDQDGSAVIVIDGSTDTVVTSIPVGSYPHGIAVDQKRNRVYASVTGGAVFVIDGATDSVLTKVKVGAWPLGVAFDPQRNLVYVGFRGNDDVKVIDGKTDTVIGTMHAPQLWGASVALDRDLGHLYVPGEPDYADDVVVFDISDGSVVTRIPAGAQPAGIRFNPTTNHVWVTDEGSSTVQVIDAKTSQLIYTLTTAPGYAVAVNPNTNRVYVSNFGSGTVTVIKDTWS